MQRIFLIRHGQTDFNAQNRVQGGGIDSDLNDTGRMQAGRFYARYASHPFRALIHTELKRTAQTLAPFASANIETLALPELNEMNWGILEGMEASPFMRETYRRMNEQWSAGLTDLPVEQGESPAGVWTRAAKGLEELFLRYPEGDLLICTHGRLLRIVLSQLLGYGLSSMNLFHHDNTGLNLLVRFPTGKFIVEKLNDISHLH